MAWDDCLTEEQKIVTKFVDTNACLLAGPGTGKTRCLTQRVVYLVEELGVPIDKILVLTFTRKAAAELRSRIDKALGPQPRANISTIHAYALSQLLKNSVSHSLPKPLRIADEFEEREIIVKDLKKVLGYTKKKVEKAKNDMSSDWAQLGDGDPTKKPDPRFLSAWNMHRKTFGYTLRSELVYQLNKAFEERAILPESFDHVIVDEYQDLNACELSVIKSLASRGGLLYVAGDDDQCIYSFRNADPKRIRAFTTDYPGSKYLLLEECKRSTPEILRMGSHVISQDLKRKSKRIFTNKASRRNSVKVLSFDNQKIEAEKVGELCSWLLHEKGIRPNDIIILLRNNMNNFFSKPIVEEMKKLSVPVSVSSDLSEVFNMPESLPPDQKKLGRVFLSYLRLIHNSEDQLAWRSLIDLEKNGLGKKTISDITNYAQENEISFYKTLKMIEGGRPGITTLERKVTQFVSAVEQVIHRYSNDPNLSVEEIISNLASEVIQVDSIRDQIIDIMGSYLILDPRPSLENILKSILLVESDRNQDQPEECVRIMTMHQAKGLDAKNVIIIGAEKELVPGRDSGAKLEDALRLMYVSVTRAQDHLIITHCNHREPPQCYSGSGSLGATRRLCGFISGGPFRSEPGIDYIDSIIST